MPLFCVSFTEFDCLAVVYNVGKNIDSSSKSNALRCRQKNMTRRCEDGCVVVEKKYIKSRTLVKILAIYLHPHRQLLF